MTKNTDDGVILYQNQLVTMLEIGGVRKPTDRPRTDGVLAEDHHIARGNASFDVCSSHRSNSRHHGFL